MSTEEDEELVMLPGVPEPEVVLPSMVTLPVEADWLMLLVTETLVLDEDRDEKVLVQ